MDAFEPITTVCRSAAGVCDAPDSCDGATASCPADLKLTSECRFAVDSCDAAESCDGITNDCPVDEVEPDGTICDDGDICTEPDECVAGVCEGMPSESPPLVCEPAPPVPTLALWSRLLLLASLATVGLLSVTWRSRVVSGRTGPGI